MIRFVAVFYLLLALISVFLIEWRTGANHPRFPALALPELSIQSLIAFLGCLVVALVLNISFRFLLPRFGIVRSTAKDVQEWLGKRSSGEIAVVALGSGLGEELFFRGWLLNEVGLVISSLVFGAVHLPPNRNWIYWPFFAAILGLLLGALCLWTQTLVFAIFLHAFINFLNLRTALGLSRKHFNEKSSLDE